MKKMLYILMMILLGIGTNAFGDWTVVNQTDEDLSNVEVCVAPSRMSDGGKYCKNLTLAKGQAGIIKTDKPSVLGHDYDAGKLLSITIKRQSIKLPDLGGARSGKFSIQGGCPGYSFKLES